MQQQRGWRQELCGCRAARKRCAGAAGAVTADAMPAFCAGMMGDTLDSVTHTSHTHTTRVTNQCARCAFDHRHTRNHTGTHPHVHKTCKVQAWRAPLSALAEQNHGPWPPAYSAASTARKDGSPDGVPNLPVISRRTAHQTACQISRLSPGLGLNRPGGVRGRAEG